MILILRGVATVISSRRMPIKHLPQSFNVPSQRALRVSGCELRLGTRTISFVVRAVTAQMERKLQRELPLFLVMDMCPTKSQIAAFSTTVRIYSVAVWPSSTQIGRTSTRVSMAVGSIIEWGWNSLTTNRRSKVRMPTPSKAFSSVRFTLI